MNIDFVGSAGYQFCICLFYFILIFFKNFFNLVCLILLLHIQLWWMRLAFVEISVVVVVVVKRFTRVG